MYLLGCGTGKYLGLPPESFVVGSDSCLEFGEIAAAMGHNVVTCDNQNLPFRNSCFDAVISVGVIHHFASVKRRMKALEELYRILQPGGKMLVYVWAFEQDERKVCYLILLQYIQLQSIKPTPEEQTLLVDGGREMKGWNNKNI